MPPLIPIARAHGVRAHRVAGDFDTPSRSEITKWGESTQEEMCMAGIFVKL